MGAEHSPFGLPFDGQTTPFDAPAHREHLRQIREAQRATWEANNDWNRYEQWRAERAALRQEAQR